MGNNVHPVYIYIYNAFTIPDSADLDILTFIKSLHWFNELIGLSDIFLTKYVLYFTINSLSKASYAKLANSCVYTVYYCRVRWLSYNRTPDSQSRKPTLKSFFATVSMHAYFRSLHDASVYSAI